jgi:3-oxoacyl-[acyl-carrier-protein] synthase-3
MNAEVLAKQEFLPYMDGRTVFKLAVTLLPEVARELLEKAGIQLEDLDMVVPHQANLRINEAFRDRMKIPEEKVYNNIQQYGNTTAATIPIALDELMEKGMLKSGDNVMFIGLGAGLTWGGAIYRLP